MQAATQVMPPKVVHTIPATINLQEEVKNAHKQLRVAAYCRVSTKQEDQLNSYDVQRRAYTDKINGESGWTMVGIYADKGITGTSVKKRDDFNRLMRHCKQGKVDMIITKSVARFARNTLDCLKHTRMLKEHNVDVYFEEQGIHSIQPGAEFYITIYGSIAQSESENISANVRWGKSQSAKEGNVPFHYKRFLGYRRGSDGKPEIDPEQAAVVKRIYERFLAGDSLATIANDLNADGIPTPSGIGQWQRGTIESILTNEKYKGVMTMSEKTNYEKAKELADKIDEEIIAVLQSGKSFKVEAGAGSGKTYSLHGVVEWIDKHKAKEYKRNGKHVACLTYTNAAVEVIASRIFSDSFIIPSTIHSFAWENIQNFRSSLVVAAKELDFIPSDHTVEEVKRVVYDLGIRYLEEDGTLHLFHDDIIKIFAWFLDKEKFRMLLSDKYPLILIDEYQDTFKIITDKFLTYFIDLGKGPQFGFFGDSWQTIYASNGACGSIQSENIIEIKKGSNFRSQAVIVDALNQIRPNLPQISALDENDGEIIVITTNEFIGQRSTERNYKDDLPDQVLSSYINAVQEKLKKRGWGSDNKVLMITHRMLARHQNYPNLFDALGDHFREQDDIHFVFFRDRIEPLYNALVLNDTKLMFDALGAGRRPIETKKQKKQWQAVKRGLEIARQGTIYDVLKAAYDSRLIPIQPEIERLKKLYEAEEPQEYHKTTLARFYAIQYEEVVRAINFFKVDGMYSTDHGVKGEEYDNVLLVMGRGWNLYKFEDILWKEESQLAGNDLKAYIRNRNLFYVCCSRPRKRLAILITVPISDQFRNYLNRVFGTQNVIEYTRFIKW